MRGERVIVRTADSKLVVRKIWEITHDKIFICSSEMFESFSALEASGMEFLADAFPIGFPKCDVYHYAPRVADRFADTKVDDPSIWDQLDNWREDERDEEKHAYSTF